MKLSELIVQAKRCCKPDEDSDICLCVLPANIYELRVSLWDSQDPEFNTEEGMHELTAEFLSMLPEGWRTGTSVSYDGKQYVIIFFGHCGATVREIGFMDLLPEGLIEVDV